jgi:MoxR-like ATPase
MSQPARAVSHHLDATAAQERLSRIAAHLGRALAGKEKQIQLALISAIAGGHLLLEDVPGVGKTTLAEALAKTFALSFARIQFTADLMPADIVGAQVFRPQSGAFEFRPGPIFHQLVLADELNRAPPRTQSALLEAMAQGQVSVDGVSHPLPRPVWGVATQNPVDLSGTFPLPDSQLDRFQLRLSLGHPSAEVEAALLSKGAMRTAEAIGAASSPEELIALQDAAASVRLTDAIAAYVVELVGQTRRHPDLERGASTRASLSLAQAARAHALLEGRDFVTPADVRAVIVPTLAHRILLKGALQGAFSREEASHLLEELVRKVPAPR